ncbi:hypothetical protein IFM89_026417 [Coptis chinensis]|uniref:RNase H type-1 domain-containing protein n=1 Tax=Coptis chinensis TaxID=261450 RepID=A0A835HK76_9MAGN|nr:hypothetical protein IFM89_026417 [Coptis chinensis]
MEGLSRDSLGNVVRAYAGCFRQGTSPYIVKSKPFCVGLKRAQEMGIENLEVNSDSLGAINILKGSERSPWKPYQFPSLSTAWLDNKVIVLESEKRAWENSAEAQAIKDALNPWRNLDAEKKNS